jgi:N-acetylglucosaminyldiphosphoundecaprenol N-acetyl-beta-D-mannosaminyltransferase
MSGKGAFASLQVHSFSMFDTQIFHGDIDSSLSLLKNFLKDGGNHSIYFVSGYSMNIASANYKYRRALKNATLVFSDGIALKLASQLNGFRTLTNVSGTDLVPWFLTSLNGDSGTVYLLGGTEVVVKRAVNVFPKLFPGWEVVGSNNGFFEERETELVVEKIKSASPDLLLVGMGTPLQEIWVDQYRHQLRVPLCMCVGGLFKYWGNGLQRAPRFFRNTCLEWLWLLFHDPTRWRKCAGNLLFIARSLSYSNKNNMKLNENFR